MAFSFHRLSLIHWLVAGAAPLVFFGATGCSINMGQKPAVESVPQAIEVLPPEGVNQTRSDTDSTPLPETAARAVVRGQDPGQIRTANDPVVPPVPGNLAPNYAQPPSPTTEVQLTPVPQLPDQGSSTGLFRPFETTQHSAPLDIYVDETSTGRFNFGVGVNSDLGVTGQIMVDERNFDLFRIPRGWNDFANGKAFRGAGQAFHMEAVPGNQLHRYVVSITEPYLFSTPVSMTTSGFFFTRYYQDWSERRLGGRLAWGYRLTPDLSVAMTVRGEEVEIYNPRVSGVAQLDAVIGDNDLYSGRISATHDTRDSPFAPTEGHLIELSYEQVFGDFDYSRYEAEYRRYFLLKERADGSGRHTLGFIIGGGISGEETPIFENYFAGGFSTIRGFSFRGASPVVNGVVVGGRMKLIGSLEYLFPITADDMIKGAVFTDFGTVETDLDINGDQFRVAPGFGFRVAVPALGPAPLAFDFAFPIAHADTDELRVFSFFVGFGR